MEKVIAALWAPKGEGREAYGERLLATLPQALRSGGARRIRLNIRDAAVAPAESLVQQWQTPQQAAVVQFWMPSANARFRDAVDAALAAHSSRFALWLVCESEVIPNTDHPVPIGDRPERTWGWSQASFISFRRDITHKAAVAHWHSHHTAIAIETQSNFEYVQNMIVRPLTEDAPDYDAFVEECFPAEAMTDQPALYAAVGDRAKFESNLKAMLDSCDAFIDPTRIDIIPNSQFSFAHRA